MDNWEYMTMDYILVDTAVMCRQMTEFGNVGWEAYSTIYIPGMCPMIRIFFKRKIQQ